ncbi:MAG: DUF4334 domain-containing protein [Bacteroidota bacterium]
MSVQTLPTFDKPMTTQEAYDLFDSLDVASIDFMRGRWRGGECKTGHSMDGLLEATGWYGKHFVSEEIVHPLLFSRGKTLYAVNPALAPLSGLIPKWGILKYVMYIFGLIVQTKQPKARLRMMEFRGKMSAAMVYDARPIIDCFRKLDDSTLLGLMDMRNMEPPCFFLLHKDESEKKQRYKTS